MAFTKHAGGIRYGALLGTAVGAAGLSAGLMITMMGQLRMMDLGGYVASGGPYTIAHPAPEWAWVLPVAFVSVWVFAGINIIFAGQAGGFGLGYATWCAAFTWAGANFLWYGFSPPGGAGLAWGWLVSGIVFTLVGLASTWVVMLTNARERYRASVTAPKGFSEKAAVTYRRAFWEIQLLSIAAGLVGGYALFGSVAG